MDKNYLCYYNFCKFDLSIYKDKLVLHYVKDVLISLKKYNKPNFCNIKKKNYNFYRVLKCITKRQCVTSRVRKDAKGFCISF